MFATDFSGSSVMARRLLPRLTWPSGTRLEVLHVLSRPRDLFSAFWDADEGGGSGARRELSQLGKELEGELFEQDVAVSCGLRAGDPATRIVERARELNCDVVVVGSRGRGALATTLLGSVSADVVDRAHCSVLVVRTERVGAVLVGDDGSTDADAGGAAIDRWPLFDSAQVTVGSVVQTPAPVPIGAHPHMEFLNAYDAAPGSARERASEVVGRRMRQLRAPGRVVIGRVREGDPAEELLALARADGCDLIVLGTGEKGRLTRLLLGGVARSVLLRFRGSVLIGRSARYSGQESNQREREDAEIAG